MRSGTTKKGLLLSRCVWYHYRQENPHMIGHIYRYQHPVVDGLWLYVGQGAKRDLDHRHLQFRLCFVLDIEK